MVIYFPLSRYNTIFHLLCHLLKVLFDFIYTYLMTCVACELNHPCDAFVIFSCGSSEMLNLACVGRLEQVYCTYATMFMQTCACHYWAMTTFLCLWQLHLILLIL